MNLIAPDEHHLLVFWSQLLVLLLVARLLGGACRRFGQPAVVGELTAGLLLGPSVFGRLLPGEFEWLFPGDEVQSGMLFAVGWIGVVLLLVVTGFETDLGLIAKRGRATAVVPLGSLAIPAALGFGVGWLMPGAFVGDGGDRTVFALFMAAALSISALPVIAKVLVELGLMRRNFGQVILAAGMVDDIVGWLALGVIAGLARSGAFSAADLALTLVGLAAFLAVVFTIGQRAVDTTLRRLRATDAGVPAWLSVIAVFTLGCGVVTQYLGVEAVLGAFVGGIVLGRSKYRNESVEQTLETVTVAIFAPIFFATAGLRVDLGQLADPTTIIWAAIVLLMASVSKFGGSMIGAKLAGLPNREGLALGVGLNARGSLEIIIASVGLSLGVLNTASYSILVLMAMATSIMAPPMLRAIVRNWRGDAEEQERLQREETLSRNIVVRNHRLLLPSRGGPNSIVAAQLLHLAWPDDVEATVLSVGDADETGVQAVIDSFPDRPVDLRRVEEDDASRAIIDEARLGYGVLAVGAPDEAVGPWLLSPIVDELLASTSIPIVIVRRARNLPTRLPGAFARALVPVSAAESSRAAQEIAFNVSATMGTEVVLLHVVNPPGDTPRPGRIRSMLGRLTVDDGDGAVATLAPRVEVGDRVVERAELLAGELGVTVRSAVRTGPSTAREIIAAAGEMDADLVVLGANLRRLEGRPFLGHLVEEVLDGCDSTVVVVAKPTAPPA